MADRNIGLLTPAPNVADDSLFAMEQQGEAMKVSGLLLKNYAKEGVELEFEGDLAASRAAADRAESAAKSIVDMKVAARTLESGQNATVSKGMIGDVVQLTFGLPKGDKGDKGETGATGARGAQGSPGSGLKILGKYDTEAKLKSSVPNPSIGDAYGVGTEAPYDVYVYDGVTESWVNYGPLSAGGGGEIPEGVVTTDGGGELTFSAAFGDAPFIVEFTDEEEPPLDAEDIAYYDGSVKDAIDQLFQSVSDGKEKIASAVSDKGIPTSKDATFQQMADNIRDITTGTSTSDATATPGDIVAPKTAYTVTGKVSGIIPSLPAHTYTPTTKQQTISPGNYVAGTQTIQGDTNLTPSNIRRGISIFGVAGAMESSFSATLTVTVDIGAEVTATHSDGVTKVSALCTTGAVTLELPIEGQWTVTAQRGVAQYNSVIINVSSSYSAALTAEVHIEYYTQGTEMHEPRYNHAGTSNGAYAIFCAGSTSVSGATGADTYSASLVRQVLTKGYNVNRANLAATAIGEFALFGGGYNSGYTPQYVADLIRYDQDLSYNDYGSGLSVARSNLAATSIGSYALFGGGRGSGSATYATIDAFTSDMSKVICDDLISSRYGLGAVSTESHALFGGGNNSSVVDGYTKNLVRTIIPNLSGGGSSMTAALAGNYAIFTGGSINRTVVDAYDLFLTHTTGFDPLPTSQVVKATSIMGYAIICGATETYVYDAFLTRTTPASISTERYGFAVASIDKYALISGGQSEDGMRIYTTVDAYRHV